MLRGGEFFYIAPMFIGHHGVAFAAKAAAPRASLSVFFLATMWLDLVWPVLVLGNIEIVRIVPGLMRMSPFDFVFYPYSHSLFFAILWALAFNLVYGYVMRDWQVGALAGLVVLSHWFLDMLVHRPDLPLFPGSESSGSVYGIRWRVRSRSNSSSSASASFSIFAPRAPRTGSAPGGFTA